MAKSQQERLEGRLERKGGLSKKKAAKLQTLRSGEESRDLAAEIKRLEQGPSQADIDKEADEALTAAGAVAQAGTTEASQAMLGAGGAIQAGRQQEFVEGTGAGVAEAGAMGRLGARELMEKIFEGRIARKSAERNQAMDRVTQEDQFGRQLRSSNFGTGLQTVGSALLGGASLLALGGCWVAEELFGPNHPKTHMARLWASTHDNWFTRLYSRRGQSWANRLRRRPWMKLFIRPIWEVMALLGYMQLLRQKDVTDG